MLLGREDEQNSLDAHWHQAQRGRSGVVSLLGDPGIGKSTLLADLRERAVAAGHEVLSTSGMEGESGIAYVNLADIFRRHHHLLSAIPERQADALASILAIGPSRPADRFTVSTATLSLLAAIAAAGPLLVTVDDAQWVDQASLDALLFAANRIEVDPVLLVFASRTGHAAEAPLSRFPHHYLQGLDADSARTLITTAGQPALSEASAARLVAESGGNPLALLTLPGTMAPEELALWALGSEPLPLSSVIENAFCGSVRELPESTRKALLLLGVLGSDTAHLLPGALAAQNLELDAFDPAEDARLLVSSAGRLEFRHPLIRAAVYQTASSGARRRAHQLAARLLADAASPSSLERRGWHLVAGGTAADEDLAGVFSRAADAEYAAANFTVSGKLYERSSALTPVPRLAMARLLRAANALRVAGAIDETRTVLQQALTVDDDIELSAAVGYALSRLEVWRGAMVAGRDTLLSLGRIEKLPALQAGELLSDGALANMVIGDMTGARAVAAQATSLFTDRPPLTIAAINAMVLSITGETAAARLVLADRGDEIDAINPLGSEFIYQLPLELGIAYLALEDVDRARDLLERCIDGARRLTAVGILPFRLGSLARIEFWQGRWASALATAHEAVRLAEETGWVSERPSSLSTIARLEAVTGHPDACRAHAGEAIALAEAAGAGTYALLGRIALGLCELSGGRHAAAIEHYQRVARDTQASGWGLNPVMWWAGDLIECYVAEGRTEDARRELDRLDRAAAAPAMPTTAAVAARCHALLEPERAVELLTEALALHARTDVPFEQARTALLLGQHLRRQNSALAAREPLTAALDTFDRLGAPEWADRARQELAASGLRISRPTVGLSELTPQELQVALAVSRGLSNKQVADQLFLSTKTIEFHLRNVFGKLGVSRRSGVAAVVARQESRPVPVAS